jgi:LPS export ABC transporter protein LptC
MWRALSRKRAFLLLIPALMIMSCAEVSLPPAPTEKAMDVPDQVLWEATITFMRDGIPVSILQAGHITKFTKRSVIYLDSGIVVDFFNEEGLHTSKLTATRGQVDEVRKDLQAFGDVIAVTDSGATLRTPELRWENQARRIVSDTRVTLTTLTDTLYGIGFVSDEHLKNWEIQKPTGHSFRTLEKPRHNDIPPPVVETEIAPRDTTKLRAAKKR